jgi:hypothetical protein
MIAHGHHVVMGIALIVFIIAVALLSIVAGADSRIDEAARRRRYLG